jgi:hypothetical protein
VSEEQTTEQQVDPLDTPEVNRAARDFNMLSTSIKSKVHSLSLRQLKRVIVAAAEFPLADSYPKFQTTTEQELFMQLAHIEGVKAVMKNAIMKSKSVEQLQKEAVDSVVEEVLNKASNSTTEGEQ